MTDLKTHETDLSVMTPGKKVSGEVFLVKKIEVGLTRRSKKYYTVWLNNKYGTNEIKIWDPHEKIDESDFVQLWMEAVNKPKWGVQWDISHYIKSSYEGDSLYGELVSANPLEIIDPIINFGFTNETIKSLVSAFRTEYMKDAIVEDSNFLNVPATKDYYYGKAGLVQYLRKIFDIGSGYEEMDKEFFNALILFHHLGSINFFQKNKSTEFFYMSEINIESQRILENLKVYCLCNNLPIDMYIFREIIYSCFNSELITPEAVIFRNAKKTAIDLYTLEKERNSSQPFTLTDKGVIFTRNHWRDDGQNSKN